MPKLVTYICSTISYMKQTSNEDEILEMLCDSQTMNIAILVTPPSYTSNKVIN